MIVLSSAHVLMPKQVSRFGDILGKMSRKVNKIPTRGHVFFEVPPAKELDEK